MATTNLSGSEDNRATPERHQGPHSEGRRWQYVLTDIVRRVPLIGPVARHAAQVVRNARFEGSASFWDSEYRTGGNSGPGSYGRLADFKAEIINAFVDRHHVTTVIEFGCGDGNQLSLGHYPSYVGVNVSPTAVAHCQKRYASDARKRFCHLSATESYRGTYDLALSLDVIFHLIEDAAFESYMRTLFAHAGRYVIVYASNIDREPMGHVRHRKFTDWVAANAPTWTQIDFVKNRYPFDPQRRDDTSYADFYMFGRGA